MRGDTLFIDLMTGNEPISVNADNGIIVKSVRMGSPNPTHKKQEIEGASGSLPLFSSYGEKTIEIDFQFREKNISDYDLMCMEVFQLFFEKDEYYIWTSRFPGIRYLVNPPNFEIERIGFDGRFTVEFSAYRGYGESRGTTQNLIEYQEELWQMGMNLLNKEDMVYSFSDKTFKVYNAGNVMIDPRMHHKLDIQIKGEGLLTIRNKNTGDSVSVSREMTSNDSFLLSGVYPYINGKHCGRDTNHGLITLTTGWNEFELSGISKPEILFDFRFLYK